MERRLSSRDAVFDPVPEGSDDDRVFNPSAFIPSESPDPAAEVESSDWKNDATSRMRRAMITLDERSRDIIENRWLTDDKQTLHELAAKYGVSAERIRQIEANAIKKLRTSMDA